MAYKQKSIPCRFLYSLLCHLTTILILKIYRMQGKLRIKLNCILYATESISLQHNSDIRILCRPIAQAKANWLQAYKLWILAYIGSIFCSCSNIIENIVVYMQIAKINAGQGQVSPRALPNLEGGTSQYQNPISSLQGWRLNLWVRNQKYYSCYKFQHYQNPNKMQVSVCALFIF